MDSSKHDGVMARSDDMYHDYTTVVIGLALDSANIKWRLESSATYIEFQSWESIWTLVSQDVAHLIARLVAIRSMSLPIGVWMRPWLVCGVKRGP